MSWPKPPLERSLFNVDPLDEFIVTISNWIWQHAQGHENIEIEAKIGKLIDISTRERLVLPVACETIINVPGVRFESDMTAHQHGSFNQLLNKLVEATNKPDYKGSRIQYQRQMEVDSFFQHPESSERIRVTRDEQSMRVTASIIKRRIADLEIYSPQREFDYRISLNTETPYEIPAGEPKHIRHKNRCAYTHQHTRVDLTLVNMPDQRDKRNMHELEVEMVDVPGFIELGEQTRRGGLPQGWTPFEDWTLIFINNVRMLIRNAAPPHPPQ